MHIDYQATGCIHSYDHVKITMWNDPVSVRLGRNAEGACAFFLLPTVVHHKNISQKVTIQLIKLII